jgi:hypothetical protein
VNKAFITIIDLEAVSPNSMQLHGYRGVARGALVIETNTALLLGSGRRKPLPSKSFRHRRSVALSYFAAWDSFAAWTSAFAKLSTFLSTRKVVTASLSACWNDAGAASPWTQLATSLSFANESIDH